MDFSTFINIIGEALIAIGTGIYLGLSLVFAFIVSIIEVLFM